MAVEPLQTTHGVVSIAVDGPDDASVTLVLAPGAGADMQHEFMVVVSNELTERGLRVVRFNFLYAEQGRKSPDRAAVLEDTYRSVVEHVRGLTPGQALFLGGKSMGGRIASQVVAQDVDCSGLVYLGYPLHPPGRPDRIRDDHLYRIDRPMLFVEGTRDPFCPIDTLQEVRERIPDSTLVLIDDGDHSFKVRKASGRTTPEAWEEVASAAAGWMLAHARGDS
jgi:predicted alpha/beta-hydrolase family hydrolase